MKKIRKIYYVTYCKQKHIISRVLTEEEVEKINVYLGLINKPLNKNNSTLRN